METTAQNPTPEELKALVSDPKNWRPCAEGFDPNRTFEELILPTGATMIRSFWKWDVNREHPTIGFR
jgi:hypothetical protein